jgi:hypothetical protein
MTQSKRTQFQPNPDGQKTARMLEVEAKIGCSLEADYHDHYIERGWRQKRLANRWGVKRQTIFGTGKRGGRRNWVQMLGLITRDSNTAPPTPPRQLGCELCGENSASLDRAHWIPASSGGLSGRDNILSLCPNCHRKLDQLADPNTIKAACAVILQRAVSAIMSARNHSPEQLLDVCERIIGAARKRLERLGRAVSPSSTDSR